MGPVSAQRQDRHLESCLVPSSRVALKPFPDSANQTQEAAVKFLPESFLTKNIRFIANKRKVTFQPCFSIQ